MSEQQRRPRPGVFAAYTGVLPFALVLVAIVLVAGSGVTWVLSPNWARQNAVAAPRDVGSVPQAPAPTPSRAQQLVSLVSSPNSIQIPKLHAVAPVVQVGVTSDRELDIPVDPKIAGWWAGGARPGASKGTAIIAGHINYAGVTGPLAHIGTLDPGDTVYVTGLSGAKAVKVRFAITGVRTYRKTALPWAQIFSQDTVGRLAIVTCGGAFDASTGNYLDNIVAFAVPVPQT